MICLLVVCGQTVWPHDARDVAVVESAFAWRRATRERETCWCKRGVSLVSGMIGGIKSVPKECPARASYKSDPEEWDKSALQECPTRVSYKSV